MNLTRIITSRPAHLFNQMKKGVLARSATPTILPKGTKVSVLGKTDNQLLIQANGQNFNISTKLFGKMQQPIYA